MPTPQASRIFLWLYSESILTDAKSHLMINITSIEMVIRTWCSSAKRENFNHLLFSCFDENITHHNIIYSNTDILEYYENSTRASRSNTGTARKSRSRNRRVRRDGRNTIRSWVGIVPITCLQCRPRTELLRLWVSPELRRELS